MKTMTLPTEQAVELYPNEPDLLLPDGNPQALRVYRYTSGRRKGLIGLEAPWLLCDVFSNKNSSHRPKETGLPLEK